MNHDGLSRSERHHALDQTYTREYDGPWEPVPRASLWWIWSVIGACCAMWAVGLYFLARAKGWA